MNIQEQLNSLIRGNPLSVDTYLREVCKNEHISDTKASMHIYMLKLDGNNRPRTCDFCDYLINRIVDYCIPPSEIRKAKEKDAEYNTTQYTATLFRKAERLFTDLGNTGEVGELALSVLTQSFLHMPQVLCKMVLKTNLTGDSYKLNAYRSVLITNWLRGYGLARIIADNIRWHNKNKTGKNTATIIRETMRDIEEYARFRFLKYTTCYIDVLKLYLGTKGDCAAIDKIPQLNLWLEFGASKTTQISLMAMGFTRTAALEFSDLIVDENYNKEQCLHWFQTNNINAMDLPASIINEAGRIIKLQ